MREKKEGKGQSSGQPTAATRTTVAISPPPIGGYPLRSNHKSINQSINTFPDILESPVN
jgi:hypothetical protein